VRPVRGLGAWGLLAGDKRRQRTPEAQYRLAEEACELAAAMMRVRAGRYNAADDVAG